MYPNTAHRESLEVMNVAYSSKACRFPMTVCSRLLALSSDTGSESHGVKTVKSLCSELGIGTSAEHIVFMKGTPLSKETPVPSSVVNGSHKLMVFHL